MTATGGKSEEEALCHDSVGRQKNETGHKTLRAAVVLLSEGRVNEN